MLRRFSTGFAIFSIVLDGALVGLSLYVAALLRPYLNNLSFIAYLPGPLQTPGSVFLIAILVWVSVLALLGVYDGRKNYRAVDEFSMVVIGSLLAGVAIAGILYLSYRELSRALYMLFFSFALTGLISWRVAARLAFRRESARLPAQRRVLIVGSDSLARSLGGQVQAYANLGWNLVGYLDDPVPGEPGQALLGGLDQARQVTQEYQIDDVIIAMRQGTYAAANRLIAALQDVPVKIWAVPDIFTLSLLGARYENFAGLAMLDLQAPVLSQYQRQVKRVFDLILTMLLILPASLLMGLISLAIRLESHAPAIFKQVRVGEGGRLFYMYKFRTMVPEAEQMRHTVETLDDDGHLIHKTAGDPRVTRLGRILRRSSLDELPQLFNILRGEMSMVGPRPELPYLVEAYAPWQRKRLTVPQGLTGWWQVNGRSDKPMHLHTEDDLFYIQHYSLALDLRILLMTIATVLRGRGAF